MGADHSRAFPTPEATLEDALVADLGTELSRHARLLKGLASHMSGWAPPGLDWATFGLLMTLVQCGPRRQGELAGLALLDPSTVSRHVGQLVKAGLVERRPDPEDGRAVQLVASARGEELAAEMHRRRQQILRQAMSGWDADDIRRLTELFGRLNDDLDAYRPHLARLTPRQGLEPLTPSIEQES